ncbi:hypothetical protein M378DRAFT_161635 [Amanita muscaria Koide BX008]|uniref:Uncharacterized protein n=1 Tax=Amanita muscaria (strain Koide BX008) TaxID=946122 RepID=A0A0C2X9J6_AMAMK|nr:hypothetical protein M378DRAFT_161635 [Amanita muscaria Koide BX008]
MSLHVQPCPNLTVAIEQTRTMGKSKVRPSLYWYSPINSSRLTRIGTLTLRPNDRYCTKRALQPFYGGTNIVVRCVWHTW